VKIKPEEKKGQYRRIYEFLYESPMIPKSKMAERLGINWITLDKRLKEALEYYFILGPEARRCSNANTLEHIYLFNTEEPDMTYEKYRADPCVVYNARIYGFCNSLVISKEKIDVEGETLLEGPRSDYYVPFTPDHSFEQALQSMQGKIRNINPDDYAPRRFIRTRWNETVKWDEDDEEIFRESKYNLRIKTGVLIKDLHISREKINYWFDTLDKRCTIHTLFYPETLPQYQTYLSMIDTDYEDFVIDIFSELPATPSFFKVQDKLILMAYLPWRFIDDTYTRATEILSVPLLEAELLTRGIVKEKRAAIVGRSRKKDL